MMVEELVDGGAATTLTDPHDDGALQVIAERGVLVALVIRHLVDADDAHSPDRMAFTVAFDAAMRLLRQR